MPLVCPSRSPRYSGPWKPRTSTICRPSSAAGSASCCAIGPSWWNAAGARKVSPALKPAGRRPGLVCQVRTLPSSIDPWAGVSVECRVNGELRQQGNTTQFIFPLDRVIRYISAVMTLLPGDVIATGTPAGVGPLNAGDVAEVTCGGIGALSNPVAEE